jgi:hypothetical protein
LEKTKRLDWTRTERLARRGLIGSSLCNQQGDAAAPLHGGAGWDAEPVGIMEFMDSRTIRVPHHRIFLC